MSLCHEVGSLAHEMRGMPRIIHATSGRYFQGRLTTAALFDAEASNEPGY